MSVLDAVGASVDWRRVRFGNLFARVQETGHAHLQPLSVFLGDGVIPRDQRSDNHNRLGEDLGKYQRVQPDDIVFNKLRTWQGGFGVSRYTGIVSPAYIVCRPRSRDVDPSFVHHMLRSEPYLAELTRVSKWMPPSQFDVSWDEIRTLPVSLPPLHQQRRITNFLDEQVTRVDNIIAGRQRQIALEYEWFERFREAQVEGDSSTTFVPLIHLTQRNRPINYGVLMPGPRLDSGIPLVEAGDVMRGPINLEGLRRTDPAIEAEYARSRLCTGDLVMAIRGSVGAVQVVPEVDEIVNVTRDAARISVDRVKAIPSYLRHAMSTRRVREWFGLRILGAAVTGVNLADLRKVPIAVPGIATQCVTADAIDEAEEMLVANQRLMQASIAAFGDLKRSLITAAVMGEFDVSSADGSQVPA